MDARGRERRVPDGPLSLQGAAAPKLGERHLGEAPRYVTFAEMPDVDLAYPTTRFFEHAAEGKTVTAITKSRFERVAVTLISARRSPGPF